jgi:hypothetical protein
VAVATCLSIAALRFVLISEPAPRSLIDRAGLWRRHVAGGLKGAYYAAANEVRIRCKIVGPQEKADG